MYCSTGIAMASDNECVTSGIAQRRETDEGPIEMWIHVPNQEFVNNVANEVCVCS